MPIDPASGPGRFLLDLSSYGGMVYEPYPFQAEFHGSCAPYGFLGGSAGPGKTTCSLMELFVSANEFNGSDGPQVHSLALRRTYPELEKTVITRFRELFPASLYRKFNETKSYVIWQNGATLQFGSMQYESDAWSFQGQWKDIYYDELCDFTFTQWMATSAWNRCPVSRQTRKWGSGNPIGIGAVWCEDLFVKHVPCMEMDASQKAAYDPRDYPYFGATYLDNPIYANDPQFLKNLEAYPAAFRDALKKGIWGAAGGYFRGVWDEAVHLFPFQKFEKKPWWKCVAKGTLVATQFGEIPIENVEVGDMVWTRRGLRRVLRSWRSGQGKKVMCAHFSNGRTLTATADHKILINGKFIRFDDMSLGDRIETWNQSTHLDENIPSTREPDITGPSPISTEILGWQNAEQSHLDSTFTTGMQTEPITTFPTLSAFLHRIIARSQQDLPKPKNIATKCLREQLNGAKLLKAKRIFKDLVAFLKSASESITLHVRDVVSICGLGLEPSSAIRHATSVGAGEKDWTTSPASAQSAEKFSNPTKPTTPLHVEDHVDKSGVWLTSLYNCGIDDVYDLAIEDQHEFYANGVLVHNCWISGNWGYAHPASYYLHVMDDDGVVYTYNELFEQQKEPEELAAIICEWARDPDGKMPKFENFAHSFDAAAQKKTATMGANANSVNNRMIPILRKAGIPDPHESTRDKLGRDTLMRERLKKQIRLGEDAQGHPIEVPNWQVADRCTQLRRIIPVMKADADEPEKMEATTDGTDSPLQGAGYGLYAIWGKPRALPKDVQLQKAVADAPDNTALYLRALRFEENWKKTHQDTRRKPARWARRSLS